MEEQNDENKKMPGRRTISIMASPAIAPPPKKEEEGPSRASASLQSKARSLPFADPASPWKSGPKGSSKGDIRASWGLRGGPPLYKHPDVPTLGDVKVSPVKLMKANEKYGRICGIRPAGVTECDAGRSSSMKSEGPYKFKASAEVSSPGVAACDGERPATSGGDKRKKRKEAPPIYNHRHGNKIAALETAQYDEAMEQAMKDYMGDWYSPGDTT